MSPLEHAQRTNARHSQEEKKTMPNRSYALYEETPNGILRIGVFRATGNSARVVAAQLYKRYPNLNGRLYIALRERCMNGWVDGERIALDPRENVLLSEKRPPVGSEKA